MLTAVSDSSQYFLTSNDKDIRTIQLYKYPIFRFSCMSVELLLKEKGLPQTESPFYYSSISSFLLQVPCSAL